MSQVIPIEVPKGVDCLVEGCTGKFTLALKVEEELEDLLACQIRNMFVRVVASELLDPAQIGTAGSITKTFEIDKAGEFLIPVLAGDYVV